MIIIFFPFKQNISGLKTILISLICAKSIEPYVELKYVPERLCHMLAGVASKIMVVLNSTIQRWRGTPPTKPDAEKWCNYYFDFFGD